MRSLAQLDVAELIATTSIATAAVAVVAGVQIVTDDCSLLVPAWADASRGSGRSGRGTGVR